MREILFRAKAINREPDREYRTKYKNGDWVYGLISRIYKYTEKMEMTNTDGISGIDVDPSTVCQFTGLTDKNGTKIFEGDVVRVKGLENDEHWKHYDETGKVAFVDGTFLIEVPKEYNGMKHYSKIHSYYMATANWVTREVIGNIFDNKEILQ